MNARHRVVITGIGLTTPVGATTQTTWQSLIAGQSGISYITQDERYPQTPFGLVDLSSDKLTSIFPPNKQRKTDRFIQLAIFAAHQAMKDAGFTIEEPESRQRFGVYIGVGVGGLKTMSDGTRKFDEIGRKGVSPFLIPKLAMSEAASWLSMEWNLQGPSVAVSNACASSTDAIGFAFRQIRDGYADYMLSGGTESCLTPLSYAAFSNMRVLSKWDGDASGASRPFDKNRTGFVMAEGAGILVLERMDLAKKRGAHIYAEVIGYGATSDAFHITSIHPDGRGAIQAINAALKDGEIDPSAIGYINAHGTGTIMNDPAETQILKKVFGDHVDQHNASRAVISSTKSMTGHMLGATGGIEASITALALNHQVVPPTINLETPDEACDLDFVPGTARSVSIDYAMSHSFGFGGGNSVLVFKASQ